MIVLVSRLNSTPRIYVTFAFRKQEVTVLFKEVFGTQWHGVQLRGLALVFEELTVKSRKFPRVPVATIPPQLIFAGKKILLSLFPINYICV